MQFLHMMECQKELVQAGACCVAKNGSTTKSITGWPLVRGAAMLKELAQLSDVLPKLKNKFQFLGAVVLITAVYVVRYVAPNALPAQIAAGAIGVIFLVFAQLLPILPHLPKTERAKFVIRMFYGALTFILLLIGLIVYFLSSTSTPTRMIASSDAGNVTGTETVLKANDCSILPTLRSINPGEQNKVTVTFKNSTSDTARLYWVDYEGKRKDYGELKPDASMVLQTYYGHPFIFTSQNESCLAVFFPSGETSLAVLK